MPNTLKIEAGQCSKAGVKPQNEDSCGIYIPEDEALNLKGIVAITADGVGSSEAGREASEHCVRGFIADYYSTPDSWTVQTSGGRVIAAINSWLYSEGQRRYAAELSLASTLAVLVLKSTTAHFFHVGDSRIWLIRKGRIRCLTKDHRLGIDHHNTALARAMGGDYSVRTDYATLDMRVNDTFVLTTDGVHEYIIADQIKSLALSTQDTEIAAQNIVADALKAGSNDNVTCQILRITRLPDQDENEYYRNLTELPFPPPLAAGMTLDGYRIIKELHASVTIQVYLAEDIESGDMVVIKTPSVNFDDDPAYIDRFMHEEWVGRRINHAHVFKVHTLKRKRSSLYYVTEFLEGQSLAQWILDHPNPDLGEVRSIVEQIVKGLRAFHRREMVHQDLKPENVMINQHGVIKIIDFGCVQVAGLKEVYTPVAYDYVEGTANYIAPELFEGFEGTPKSDLYSLGVMVYEILSGGKFPYGEQERAEAHKNYMYITVRRYNRNIPAWIDGAIKKAVYPDPEKRYDAFSEFLHDLSKPNPDFMQAGAPLLERNPLGFWRGLAVFMLIINIILMIFLSLA